MASTSERINNCKKTGRYLEASLKLYTNIVAEKAATKFGGKLGEQAIKVLFAALLWLIVQATDRLGADESEYVKEQGEDVQAREKRNLCTSKLIDGLSRVRSRLDAIGGEALVERCNFSGSIPSQPQRLISFAQNASAALRDFSNPITDEIDGSVYDPTKSAAFLEKHTKALEESLGAVELDKRETQDALDSRDTAFTNWKLAYRCVSSITEGFYRLAEMERAAEQIRFRSRRRRGDEAPSDEPTIDQNPTGETPTS